MGHGLMFSASAHGKMYPEEDMRMWKSTSELSQPKGGSERDEHQDVKG